MNLYENRNEKHELAKYQKLFQENFVTPQAEKRILELAIDNSIHQT